MTAARRASGWYPCFLASSRTRFLVATEIFGLSRNASDTAEGERRASLASWRRFILGEQLTSRPASEPTEKLAGGVPPLTRPTRKETSAVACSA